MKLTHIRPLEDVAEAFRIAETYSDGVGKMIAGGDYADRAACPLTGNQFSSFDFRIYSPNHRAEISVSKGIGLKASRIAGMTRHVIGHDRAGKLHVAQNPHDFEEIQFSFVGVNLFEVVQVAADVAHMDLV
jgi:hypothetical protein